MNIMFLAPFPMNPNVGGIQRVSDVLARELLKRGHHIISLCYEYRDYLNDYKYPAKQYFVEKKKYSDVDFKAELDKIVEDNNIQYAIAQNLDSNHVLGLLPDYVKVVTTLHVQPFALENISRKRIWRLNVHSIRQFLFKSISLINPKIYETFFEKIMVRELQTASNYSDKLCFLSNAYITRLHRHIPDVKTEQCCAISNPNSFDVEEIAVPRYEDRENLIIWVGRVENSQKNCIDFLRMWKSFSKVNKNWTAIVIGEGEDRSYNENYVAKNNLERITFVGRRSDVAVFYKRAKIMAMTSYGEGFPMVVNEAMAYGCVPCVYDTFESLHEVVADGYDGIIVPSVNPQSMASKLQTYVMNESRLATMSSQAHETVKKFSVINIVDKWEKLLETL